MFQHTRWNIFGIRLKEVNILYIFSFVLMLMYSLFPKLIWNIGLREYLKHKRMTDSRWQIICQWQFHIIIHLCTQSRKKNKRTNKWKKRYKIDWNGPVFKPHIFWMLKKGCYPLGNPGLGDSCAQIGNCTAIKIILFTMIPEDWVKGYCIFICLRSMVHGCLCPIFYPNGTMGWPVVCDCGISWQYSLTV